MTSSSKPRLRYVDGAWTATSHPPSLQLVNQVRAAFIVRGTTLGKWCRDNGLRLTNVRAALVGTWNGAAGQKMRRRVVEASGMREAA